MKYKFSEVYENSGWLGLPRGDFNKQKRWRTQEKAAREAYRSDLKDEEG